MRGPRMRWVAVLAGVVGMLLLAVVAVVSPGFDKRETPPATSSVWTYRDSGQYARVNVDTAEIDTVRAVDEPSGVLQSGEQAILLAQGNTQGWAINAADPSDLGGDKQRPGARAAASKQGDEAATSAGHDTAGQVQLPGGVREAVQGEGFVAFRTGQGRAYVARFEGGGLTAARQLRPSASGFSADAIAVLPSGKVAVYSAAAHRLSVFAAQSGSEVRSMRLPAGVPADASLTMLGEDEWALLSGDSKRLWASWLAAPVQLQLDGNGQLQQPSGRAAKQVVVADRSGLVRVSGEQVRRVVEFAGVPARPADVGGKLYAAWLSRTSGLLWAGGKQQSLTVDDAAQLREPEPQIRANGAKAVLTEQHTGMLWTLPDGKLIPLKQWSLADEPDPDTGSLVMADVSEQLPPTAVDDSFGVRPGVQTLLPVLLNDSDPNKQDLLSVVPGDTLAVPEDFGTLTLLGDGQTLAVRPSARASGRVSFTYRVTDGIEMSAPATVTLRVVADEHNSAPEWCPVRDCQRTWGAPDIAPGGTTVLPVLDAWVDPEGDSFTLRRVDVTGPGAETVRAMVTGDGKLAVRHLDGAGADVDVTLRLTVADSRGEITEKDLAFHVKHAARAVMQGYVAQVSAGAATELHPLERVVGGSGSFALAGATVQSGGATATPSSDGTLRVTAPSAGVSSIAVSITDTGTGAKLTGNVRVVAGEQQTQLSLPPLRAYVQPYADTTLAVLDSLRAGSTSPVAVTRAVTTSGMLRAEVMRGEQVRVQGFTESGEPGLIGTADVTVTDGKRTSTGSISVYQVDAEPQALAVPDTVSVRAGEVADIHVLYNDVAAPGTRLLLNPHITGSGAKGELAFASGNTLRYLAPQQPGTYILGYTAFVASAPESSDAGSVTVTVLPQQGNRNPEPAPLTARVRAGESITLPVQEFGNDPDGDRVRLTEVTSPRGSKVSAGLGERPGSISVTAAEDAPVGTTSFTYRVRDARGATATGTVSVLVTPSGNTAHPPVAYTDYVRMVTGEKKSLTVRPLDNDSDPAGGKLQLVDVQPLLPGSADAKSPEARRLAARIDRRQLKQGVLKIAGSASAGTASYRYTVRSELTGSTSEGLIVVQASARVGATAPVITDTVLTARDRTLLESGGIDVVSGHVSWADGDVASLRMEVWGEAQSRYTVIGKRVSGSYRAEGDTVPLRFTGKDRTGEQVVSYGFLFVPPLEDIRITLKAGASLTVQENGRESAKLTSLVDVGAGDRVELAPGKLQNQRAQGRCTATDASTVQYEAGSEGPWSDTCVLQVKLRGQDSWTRLALPITIVPREPQAELTPLTRTIRPGESESINLDEMVRWRGGREGTLAGASFAVAGAGSGVTLAQGGARGASLQVAVSAKAVSGSEVQVPVQLTGSQQGQAVLTVVVGIALPDRPVGGTVQLACRVGESCAAKLTPAAGEHDPFAGKQGAGLQVTGITAGECAVGRLRLSGDTVQVQWPDGVEGQGGRCTAGFEVRDAQGRTGRGSIELDARGVPRAPVSIEPVAAGADSVQLSVQLSPVASYPAVSGVQLTEGGAPVGSCELTGAAARCTVRGLTPGEKHTYRARAVNEVGESAPTAGSTTTWAYRAPGPVSIRAEAVPWADNTNPLTGRVRVTLGEGEGSRVLLIDGRETNIATEGVYELPAGRHTFTTFSVDEAGAVPPGFKPVGERQQKSTTATVIGAPIAGTATLQLRGEERTDWQIEVSGFDPNGGGELQYTASVEASDGSGTGSHPIHGPDLSGTGLQPYREYSARVWASTAYGRVGPVHTPRVVTGGQLPALRGSYTVPLQGVPSADGRALLFQPGGVTIEGQVPGAEVRYTPPSVSQPEVHDLVQCMGERCSAPATLRPAEGSIWPFAFRLTGQCLPGAHSDTFEGLYTLEGDPRIPFTLTADTAGAQPQLVLSWSGQPHSQNRINITRCEPTPEPGEPEPPGPGAEE